MELRELTPSFQKSQEVAENLQKGNNARKTQMYIFRGLRVKALVTILQKYLKPSFSSLLDSWFSTISESSLLKVFSPVISLLLTLRTCPLVQNLKKNTGNFTVLVCCTAAS